MMGTVTKEMLLKLTLGLHASTTSLNDDLDALLADFRSLNADMAAMHHDLSNIASILLRQEVSLDRIATRLGAAGEHP